MPVSSTSFRPEWVALNSDAASDAQSKASVALSKIAASSSAWEAGTLAQSGAAASEVAQFKTASVLRGRTFAALLGDLSGQASSAFDWNSQGLTGIASLKIEGTSSKQHEVAATISPSASWGSNYGTYLVHDFTPVDGTSNPWFMCGTHLYAQIPSTYSDAYTGYAYLTGIESWAANFSSQDLYLLYGAEIYASSSGGGDVEELQGLFGYGAFRDGAVGTLHGCFFYSNVRSLAGQTTTATKALGLEALLVASSSGAAASTTVTDAYALRARVSLTETDGGSLTVTNLYGMYIEQTSAQGSITNHYGLYIEEPTGGGTANYAIYTAGGAHYFAGDVGIGTNDPKFLGHIAGRLCYGVPDSAPTDADISNSQVTAYLDETNNKLKFRVKYAGGTLKTGEVALA